LNLNPNTPLNSNQLQNPPKIITEQWLVAWGSSLTIPEQLTMNQGSLIMYSTKPWKKIQDTVNMRHEKAWHL